MLLVPGLSKAHAFGVFKSKKVINTVETSLTSESPSQHTFLKSFLTSGREHFNK